MKESNIPEKRELRIFCLIWTGIFLIISLLPFLKGGGLILWSFYLSMAFLAIAAFYPMASLTFYRVWIKFGRFIGWINTKIILGIIFYLIITPAGLLMRMIGKDLLNKKIDLDAKTYWMKRDMQSGSMKNRF